MSNRNKYNKQSLEKANHTINNKFPYLKIIKYNGCNKIAKFIDSDFGEFDAIYSTVLKGKAKHKERVKLNRKKAIKKKYGVDNVFQLNEIKEKIKKTNLEKYGVESPQQNKKVREKTKQTNLYKYGVEYPLLNKKIRQKSNLTCLKNDYYHNINGLLLSDFYKKNNFIISYNTFRQNYYKYKEKSLDIKFYLKINKISKKANLWLEQIEQELGYKLIREYHIPNTLYNVDGYDLKTNTIYEFYGDYWHGYPFKKKGLNKHKNISFNTLYYKTIDREEKIKKLGYYYQFIWENDFNI